jgi:hypothetical protein
MQRTALGEHAVVIQRSDCQKAFHSAAKNRPRAVIVSNKQVDIPFPPAVMPAGEPMRCLRGRCNLSIDREPYVDHSEPLTSSSRSTQGTMIPGS